MDKTRGVMNNNYLYKINAFTRDVQQGDNVSKGNLGTNGYAFFGTDAAAYEMGENGRLNGLKGNDSYKVCDKDANTFKTEALRGIQTDSDVSVIFFSLRNVEQIQAGIRYSVNQRTKKTIAAQDTDQLKIIMRSIYLQYSQNLSNNVGQQVTILNKKVIDYSVPQIITNMEQYYSYLKDITTQPQYMTHPVNVSSKGEKTYALDYFI